MRHLRGCPARRSWSSCPPVPRPPPSCWGLQRTSAGNVTWGEQSWWGGGLALMKPIGVHLLTDRKRLRTSDKKKNMIRRIINFCITNNVSVPLKFTISRSAIHVNKKTHLSWANERAKIPIEWKQYNLLLDAAEEIQWSKSSTAIVKEENALPISSSLEVLRTSWSETKQHSASFFNNLRRKNTSVAGCYLLK